jgi:hypothetical protein
MSKRRSVIPLNPVQEAFVRYGELMPFVTDVRGERVVFDLGSYAHLIRKEGRERYIAWIRETLENPEEIRRDFNPRHPEREVYINTLYESEDGEGHKFIVVVSRQVELVFWTAFKPDDWYMKKVSTGRLLWRAIKS